MRFIKSVTVITIAAGLCFSGLVLAQEPSIYENPSPVDKRKVSDASVDRNIMMPGAETISAGELTFNSYELFLAGLTYGFTDNTQLTLTTLLPIVEDIPFMALGSFKWRIAATDTVVFSVMPSASVITQSGVDGAAGTLGVAFLLDVVLGKEGDFALSFAETNNWAWGTFGDDTVISDGFVMSLSAGANYRVHKYVKIMTEFIVPGIVGDSTEIFGEATVFAYGVRFCSHTISVDLAFLRPVEEIDFLVMGFPYVTFSARF